jgi:hypothetical protein
VRGTRGGRAAARRATRLAERAARASLPRCTRCWPDALPRACPRGRTVGRPRPAAAQDRSRWEAAPRAGVQHLDRAARGTGEPLPPRGGDRGAARFGGKRAETAAADPVLYDGSWPWPTPVVRLNARRRGSRPRASGRSSLIPRTAASSATPRSRRRGELLRRKGGARSRPSTSRLSPVPLEPQRRHFARRPAAAARCGSRRATSPTSPPRRAPPIRKPTPRSCRAPRDLAVSRSGASGRAASGASSGRGASSTPTAR